MVLVACEAPYVLGHVPCETWGVLDVGLRDRLAGASGLAPCPVLLGGLVAGRTVGSRVASAGPCAQVAGGPSSVEGTPYRDGGHQACEGREGRGLGGRGIQDASPADCEGVLHQVGTLAACQLGMEVGLRQVGGADLTLAESWGQWMTLELFVGFYLCHHLYPHWWAGRPESCQGFSAFW